MSNRRLFSSLVIVTAALGAAVAGLAGSAVAGVRGNAAMRPLQANAAPVGSCDWATSPFASPFLQWGDTNLYFPLSGGMFEPGTSGWTLMGGAAVAAGNESFYAHSPSDQYSLAVPNGGSATSPQVCVNALSPALRLFARNTGGTDRQLSIFVNYTATDGKPHSAKVVDLKAGASWAPTAQVRFLGLINDLLNKNGQAAVSFTFSVAYQKDHPGNWQIDDVSVDPYKAR